MDMYAIRDACTHLVDLIGHDGHGAQAWVADGQHLGRHLHAQGGWNQKQMDGKTDGPVRGRM